jgi:hypothetical protein
MKTLHFTSLCSLSLSFLLCSEAFAWKRNQAQITLNPVVDVVVIHPIEDGFSPGFDQKFNCEGSSCKSKKYTL